MLCVVSELAAESQGGGEDAEAGDDVAGGVPRRSEDDAPTEAPQARPAARRLHARRTDVHHHRAHVERRAARLLA